MPAHYCIGNPCIICYPNAVRRDTQQFQPIPVLGEGRGRLALTPELELRLRQLIREEIASSKLKRAATCLLQNEEGKILVVSRKDDPNDIGFPGGKVDNDDEDDKTAALRELKEETGLEATDAEFLYAGDDGLGYWVVTYRVTEWSGKINTEEEGRIYWVEPEKLITHSSFAEYNDRVLKTLGLI